MVQVRLSKAMGVNDRHSRERFSDVGNTEPQRK